MMLRIPGWARNEPVPSDLYYYSGDQEGTVTLTLNGKSINYEMEKGYAVIERNWTDGDIIELDLPMEIRRVHANDKVEEDLGKTVIERGPIVYCFEGHDNDGVHIHSLMINEDGYFDLLEMDDLDYKYYNITAQGTDFVRSSGEKDVLETKNSLVAIPYYLWANRGLSDMRVWLPRDETAVEPAINYAPSIASNSTVRASFDTTTLALINDRQVLPYNQNIPVTSYYRWPLDEITQWVQYEFEKPETVSSVQVYWYDNEPSRMTTWYDDYPYTCCRVPESWELYYLDPAGKWLAVEALDEFGTEKYTYNKLRFKPVTTSSLKIVAERHETCATGLQEWIVE
jgi:hypothetical protein